MNRKTSWWRTLLIGTCIGCIALPPEIRAADGAATTAPVRDVALGADGSLRGTLLSPEGNPEAQQRVALLKGITVVAMSETQADGTFIMRPVRPGLYEVATAKASRLYRVWDARSAPPAAQPLALVVQGTEIVRGQDWSPIRISLILSGVIIK
jgi:hypothetical protein